MHGALIRRYDLRAILVTDAPLAALAIEHGLTVYSADTDFSGFSEIGVGQPARMGGGISGRRCRSSSQPKPLFR